MGSCCEENSSTVDASAGSLVWVRRRNGSWWPGRVLGPEELPAKSLISPRSGTPIKLLGREDGSIDWYNLEKSTRVKAFRCGDYDECIENAKAYAARSGKKAQNEGKYVRREDAILHALKLEKLRYTDGNNFLERSNSIITADEDSTELFESMLGHSKAPNYMAKKLGMLEENPAQELSQSAVSFEEPRYPDTSDIQVMQKKGRKTPNDSEDDATEGIKRMRGLQDLGLGMVPKKKPKMLVHTKESHSLSLINDVPLSKSSIHNGFHDLRQTDRNEDYCSYLKQKRSRTVQLYDKFKKKSRRRPLMKVLEGSSRVMMPSFCHQSSSAGQSSLQGFTQNKGRASKSTGAKQTDYASLTSNSSDCSGTSSESSLDASEKGCNSFGDITNNHPELKNKVCPSRMEIVDTNCSDDHINHPGVRREHETVDFPHKSDLYLSKKFQSTAAERKWNQCSESGLISSGSTSCSIQVNHVRQKIDKGASQWTSKGRMNIRYLSLMDRVPKDRLLESVGSKTDNNSFHESLTTNNIGQLECGLVLEDMDDVPQIHLEDFTSEVRVELAEAVNGLSYARDCEALFTGNVPVSAVLSQKSPLHSNISLTVEPIRSMPVDSALYDVELNVQATYHGSRVPLVSLMSKLNGKAIIGHPVTVEILEDCCCDALLSSNDCHPAASCIQQLHRNGNGAVGKLQSRVSHHVIPRSPLLKKKLPITKKQVFSPRKIRSLSSLTVDQKNKKQMRKPVVEKMGGPVVACVPLRLVFSRLNEALGGSLRTMT